MGSGLVTVASDTPGLLYVQVVDECKDKKTKLGATLIDCIQSGERERGYGG